MKRRFKLLAVVIGVTAVLVLVAAIVLPMLIDSSHYKREVIALVKDRTGHVLHIDGNIRLHVIPGLRLTVTHIRLANPPGFSNADLARLPWLSVDVKPLPLLSGRIEPRAVEVSGLTLNLERDRGGRGNWEAATTLEQDPAAEQRKRPDSPFAALAVGELDIRDATLSWRDQISDETITVTEINLQTGMLHGGKGIDDVRLQATLPESDATIEARGDATLAATGRALVMPSLTATVRGLSIAGMGVDGTLDANLMADFAEQRLTLDTMRVSARASGSEDREIAVQITTELGFDFARQRLSESTLSAKVPTISLSGIDGELVLTGILSGDLRAGTYTLARMRVAGTMDGEALADSNVAFELGGTLNADLERRKLFAPGLEIAGNVDGDRLPFRFSADLDLSQPARTLTATGIHLSLSDWRLDGAMTLRAAESPPGVQGVLDLRLQDQPLAGSFTVTESPPGIDVRFDLVADLDIEDEGYTLRGRNAVVLRAKVNPAPSEGSWRVGDLQLGARLADASFPNGEVTIKLRADLDVDIGNEVVRSDNLHVALDNSRITGSVDVRDFDKLAVRFDLQADAIDADRYLSAAGDRGARATSVGASIAAIRALDLEGEMRVQKLTLDGVQLENVRLSSDGGASDG